MYNTVTARVSIQYYSDSVNIFKIQTRNAGCDLINWLTLGPRLNLMLFICNQKRVQSAPVSKYIGRLNFHSRHIVRKAWGETIRMIEQFSLTRLTRGYQNYYTVTQFSLITLNFHWLECKAKSGSRRRFKTRMVNETAQNPRRFREIDENDVISPRNPSE